MLLNHISERLRFRDYTSEWLGAHGSEGQLAQAEGARHLVEFRLEGGLPVWRYAVRGVVIERARAHALRAEHGPRDLSHSRRARQTCA